VYQERQFKDVQAFLLVYTIETVSQHENERQVYSKDYEKNTLHRNISLGLLWWGQRYMA